MQTLCLEAGLPGGKKVGSGWTPWVPMLPLARRHSIVSARGRLSTVAEPTGLSDLGL